MHNIHKYWHGIVGIFALSIGIASLGFDMYPQFPTMCIILGIILVVLIDTMEQIPPIRTYHWHQIWDEMRNGKIVWWKGLLFMHTKIIFPTLFTLYLILLILQKVKIVTPDWQSYATASIETLQLLWVTLVSAVLANFPGLDEKQYEVEHTSPVKNALSLVLICLLAYGGMWAVFAEIAVIGRIAYFVSLAVGILIGLVSIMILSDNEQT